MRSLNPLSTERLKERLFLPAELDFEGEQLETFKRSHALPGAYGVAEEPIGRMIGLPGLATSVFDCIICNHYTMDYRSTRRTLPFRQSLFVSLDCHKCDHLYHM
jgi:hypothetical protein